MVKVSGFLSLFENILKQIPQCDPTCYNPPYFNRFSGTNLEEIWREI
jgi:hypothetical protein